MIRERLNDLTFSAEQELTLNLELVRRIEIDIEELRTASGRAGFTQYVCLTGLAGVIYLLFAELAKANDLSLSKTGVVFSAGILLLKIPWAIYQIVTIDREGPNTHTPGRFFWSNDFLFEMRLPVFFQALVLSLSLVLTVLIPIPTWIKVSTVITFLLYLAVFALLMVLSVKKVAYAPANNNLYVYIWTPILFLISTAATIIGLFSQMEIPLGKEIAPFSVSAYLLVIVFLVDVIIRLSTPSLMLGKLQRLRYDIIFLETDLVDAWARYEVCVNGNDISEELRSELDEVLRNFYVLELHQNEKDAAVSAILKIHTNRRKSSRPDRDLERIAQEQNRFIYHFKEIDRIDATLKEQLSAMAHKIQMISSSTLDWERADAYYKLIQTRFEAFNERENQIRPRAQKAANFAEKFLQVAANNAANNNDGSET